jgi:hypothetical protein
MELKEFLQKFLPYYKEKRERKPDLTDEQFWILFFDEALQNFADKICEKQNQYCADFIAERLDDHETEPFEGGIYVDASDVLCYVEQAKIDEL